MPNESLEDTRSQGDFSVAILTYQRNPTLRRALEAIAPLRDSLAGIYVVDNGSDPPANEVSRDFPWVTLIRSDVNRGAAGRNLAFAVCKSKYLITLDDDVMELQLDHLAAIKRVFLEDDVAAINFRVTEEGTGRLVNWVHHRDAEKYSDVNFDTYEITEGAVAFRMTALAQCGGYPDEYFLSHEGPDLAFRLMNRNWRVVYSPEVTVVHLFAAEGRASWRNYYYDTRNAFWLVIRNFPFLYGVSALVRQLGVMLIFSVRDGFFLTWLRAVLDGIRGIPFALRTRQRLSRVAMGKIRGIDSFRPSLLTTLKKRLAGRVERLEA